MNIQVKARDLRQGDVVVHIPAVVLGVVQNADGLFVDVWRRASRAVETVRLQPDEVVTVEVPDQRATDAEIDQLVEATRDYLEVSPLQGPPARREKLARIADRLAPVQAPTLAEALDALRVLANEGAVGAHLNAATRLLERARRAGVMP